ncbi:MAG: KTSC domain-containing protein [Pyrinomonadaceae bacterium]
MSDLKFQPIVSSNLEEGAFDHDTEAIVVRFKNGTAYKYPNCSESLWKDFAKQFDGKQGRSAGKFLNAQLRPRAYEKLADWK